MTIEFYIIVLVLAGILWFAWESKRPVIVVVVSGIFVIGALDRFNNSLVDHVRHANPPHEVIEATLDGLGDDQRSRLGHRTNTITWDVDRYPTIVSVGLHSTYEREYHADALICSLVGPLYWSPPYWVGNEIRPALWHGTGQQNEYVGTRRIIVSLTPMGEHTYNRPIFKSHAIIPAAERGKLWEVSKITQASSVVDYIPRDRVEVITDKDEIEWCKAGEDINVLAASLGYILDANGAVTGPQHLELLTSTALGQKLLAKGDIKVPTMLISDHR